MLTRPRKKLGHHFDDFNIREYDISSARNQGNGAQGAAKPQ